MKQLNLLKNIDRKKLLNALLIIVAIVVILSIIGTWMINIIVKRAVHSRKEIVVPEIVGKTLNEALTVLSEKNLSLYKVAEKYNTEIPAGSVLSQSPPAGLIVREGKAIECVISAGGKVVFVPDVSGKSMRQAELQIRQAGLIIGEQIRTFSSTVKRDFIVSQDPESGEVVEKNSYVNIVVSKGPAEEEKIKKMPNLLGKRIAYVEQVLKDSELEIFKLKTIINDELDEGTVVEQGPEQGAIVDDNTQVRLTVSKQTRSFKEVREANIYYEVAQTGMEMFVKIVVTDDIGERVVFESVMDGGSKIEAPVKVLGAAKAKIFVDDILMKEEDIVGEIILEDDALKEGGEKEAK